MHADSGLYKDDKTHFYHNTVYNGNLDHDAYWGYAFTVSEHQPECYEDLWVINNIFYIHYIHPVNDPIFLRAFTENPNPTMDDVTCAKNHHDDAVDPKFADLANHDFHLLANSPCIDAGTWLTTTTNSGSSSTTMTVAEAGFFCDGWGIIEEDIIQLQGQTTTARITSINYGTNTITVNRSLTWTSGQGVALAYSGSGPDIGVYEYASGTPPPTCSGTCKTNTCSSYTSCTISSGTCSSGYCCTGTCTTTTPPACIEADWTYTDGTCQPNNTLVRAWTKIHR